MPEKQTVRRFLSSMRDWLVELPHDLKVLFEAAADHNLERPAREVAVGAILYTVSADHLPGVPREDFTNFCDRAILVKLALQRIAATAGPDAGAFKERFPEIFDDLDDHVALCEESLGESYSWLRDKVDQLASTQELRGKKVAAFLDDADAAAELYDEGLEFQTEYEVDEDSLADRLKKAQTIFDALDKRKSFDGRGA